MSGYCFQVPPLSIDKITASADLFRRSLGVTEDRFPLVEVVEHLIPALWEDFTFEVREAGDMGSAHGLTFPEKGLIWLRDDVYQGVLDGQGRDRFTLAHELGHLLLHNSIGMARSIQKPTDLKPYENSEWQANTFAGALLIPISAAQRLGSPNLIADACGVSLDAARVRLESLRRRGKIR
ncbi:ImmA/IrrE family metallo-endopeptidase [Stenotrophomonas acidaminiphila]|uniref:ImmA/IrrE family metallo-endopeptidase n=1 Tax=Stenotrophomonas acidaminiphila TaxID=128780 RepID=UPI0028AA1A93|nr:ImmA/IrrE family metallo-endopeptidase [Stenotrophomonas acidaminiphila]